jgi:acetyl-CoA acyltransferase
MGMKGQAILRDYMFVALDPKDQLLLGPAYGIARLLKRAGLTADDIDVWEIHEAFAGQVMDRKLSSLNLKKIYFINSAIFCRKFGNKKSSKILFLNLKIRS